MYEGVMQSVKKVPDKIAWDFMGTLCTQKEFSDQISQCADALANIELKRGDAITISIPTTPRGIIKTPKRSSLHS
jgi:long-chain acyl-CoA synthetase